VSSARACLERQPIRTTPSRCAESKYTPGVILRAGDHWFGADGRPLRPSEPPRPRGRLWRRIPPFPPRSSSRLPHDGSLPWSPENAPEARACRFAPYSPAGSGSAPTSAAQPPICTYLIRPTRVPICPQSDWPWSRDPRKPPVTRGDPPGDCESALRPPRDSVQWHATTQPGPNVRGVASVRARHISR
jgi:hypothetical protein